MDRKPTYSPDTSSYIAPTPEELEHLLFKRIAPALGIEKSKGSSLAALADIDRKKIGQWCSGSGQIPYSVLYTLVHKGLGVKITCANWRHELLQSVGEFPKGTAKEPTIVKAVRLPLELVETHQINSDWLLDAVMKKLLTPHNGRGCIGQGCLFCEEEDAEPY